MKKLQNMMMAALTVLALSMIWSCGKEDPIEEPQRPSTEKPDNGGSNNGNDNGGNTGGNNGNTGGETKPDPVVTFTKTDVSDITYNSAKFSAEYTMENVEESAQNKIVCRISSVETELDMDYSIYQELPLDKSGKVDIDLYIGEKQTFYVRLDVVVGKKVFKSNVVSFQTPEKPYIPVTGITLSETSLTLKVGDIKELEAFVQPNDADKKKGNWYIYANQPFPIEWTIVVGTNPADKDIHHIKAVNPGKATIKVEIEEGDQKFTAECEVTVEE